MSDTIEQADGTKLTNHGRVLLKALGRMVLTMYIKRELCCVDIAHDLGWTEDEVEKLMRGQRIVTLREVRRVARVLRVRPRTFFCDTWHEYMKDLGQPTNGDASARYLDAEDTLMCSKHGQRTRFDQVMPPILDGEDVTI